MKAIYDPRRDTNVHEYLPRLTLMNRIVEGGRSVTLNIEFSAPNLLYGNNFFEVEDEDFDRVIAVLEEKLLSLDVVVSREHLANAAVSKVHYGKNFLLTGYTTPFNFIQEIWQANISKRLDADKTDYRNEGHSLKYQNNTLAVMFYDKMKDLDKARLSPTKSVEGNPTPFGEFQHLLKRRSATNPIEVLRMEIQFNKRVRIRSEVKKLGFPTNLTFRELFSQRISKAVCLSYLTEIKEAIILSKVNNFDSPVDQFMSLQQANPTTKTQVILEYLGFMQLVEATDTRTARRLIAGDSASKWQTAKNKYSAITTSRAELEINYLLHAVEEFKTVKPLDF
ncbi:MAG: hypothetical protein HZA34_02010 [Candidatus Pacebacteria bacterium]|nr:hypothetical protein [Candidatus Paceibacterota bacterium]